MANNRNITSADSVFTLAVAGLYPTPVILGGYASDRAFETDAVDVAETVMGVDGNMSAGWIPNTTTQTVTLMPDSTSSDIFENWDRVETSRRTKLFASGEIQVPGTGRRYTLTRGVLKRVTRVPSAAKTMQPRAFTIEWGSIVVSGI